MTAAERAGRAGPVAPTIGDSEVLEFCKTGLLTLEAVIPESTNQWVRAYLEAGSAELPATAQELGPGGPFRRGGDAAPGGGGGLQGAPRRRLSAAGLDGQPPDRGPLADRQVAHRRGIAVRAHLRAAAGLLPAAGGDPGDGADPLSARFAPRADSARGAGALRPPRRTGIDRGAGRFGFLHRLLDLAPAVGEEGRGGPQPPEVGLLAHAAAAAGLAARAGVRSGRADYSYENGYFRGSTRKWQSVPRVAEMFTWMCGKADEFRQVGGRDGPTSASDPGCASRGTGAEAPNRGLLDAAPAWAILIPAFSKPILPIPAG